MTENQYGIYQITVPTVCIVAMKSQAEFKEKQPAMHLPYYQVTVDPRDCRGNTNGYSPTKNFIRFGYAQGDELNGWQPAHEIEIYEIIGEPESDIEIYPQLEGNSKMLEMLEKDYLNMQQSIKEVEHA